MANCSLDLGMPTHDSIVVHSYYIIGIAPHYNIQGFLFDGYPTITRVQISNTLFTIATCYAWPLTILTAYTSKLYGFLRFPWHIAYGTSRVWYRVKFACM